MLQAKEPQTLKCLWFFTQKRIKGPNGPFYFST
nr:MAG TPA: hypothetical protein [Caudoviricetes sp.]